MSEPVVSNDPKGVGPFILIDDVGYADIGAFSARINNTTQDKLYIADDTGSRI
jgi:hypothetical protein